MQSIELRDQFTIEYSAQITETSDYNYVFVYFPTATENQLMSCVQLERSL